jgi:hypothetical protein
VAGVGAAAASGSMEPPQARKGDGKSVAALQPQSSGVGAAASAAASDSEATSRGPWPASKPATPNTQEAADTLVDGSLLAGPAGDGPVVAGAFEWRTDILKRKQRDDDLKRKRLKDAKERSATSRRKMERTVGAWLLWPPHLFPLVSHLMPPCCSSRRYQSGLGSGGPSEKAGARSPRPQQVVFDGGKWFGKWRQRPSLSMGSVLAIAGACLFPSFYGCPTI